MNGTKWGYIDGGGEFAIQPDYEWASDFQKNGLATVKKGNDYGCINKSGKFVISPKFESINDFSEGRASVVYQGAFQVIDETGKILTRKPYSFISMYREGRAMAAGTDQQGNYRYGFLDREGSEAIPLRYETANDFQDGVAVVKLQDNLFALIDRHGNTLQQFPYYYVGNYGDKLLVFQKGLNEKLGYLDMQGRIVIKPKFGVALPFENGRAVVNQATDFSNKYGLIDSSGSYIVQPQFNDVNILQEYRVSIGEAIDKEKPYLGSKYAIYNWNGQQLTQHIYDTVSSYDQGIASVSEGTRAYFVDRSGNRARGLPIVEGADSVSLIGDLVRAVKNTRLAYFTKKGKLVWKQNTIIPLSQRYRVIERKYNPNRNYNVFFPQVDGLKSKRVEEEVNKKLKDISNVKHIDKDEQLDYQYSGDFNVEFFKKNLLVLELYSDMYYFGAAHGMPSKTFTNINLINGRFYQLADLFKKDSDYLEVLSDIIGKMIKTDPQYDYVFPDAYKGITAEQPFYVNEEDLFIYFPPYEIGPYVAGFPTFKIPFTEIKDIIDENGEFWLSFH